MRVQWKKIYGIFGLTAGLLVVPIIMQGQNYNSTAFPSCERELLNKVQSENRGFQRVQADPNSLNEQQRSSNEIRLDGRGQVQDGRGRFRQFTFQCSYNPREGRVRNLKYSWQGGFGNGSWNSGNGNWNNGGGNNNGGNNNGGGWNNGNWGGPSLTNYLRVKADTGGHGSFQSSNMGSLDVTRVYIDTRERPAVGVSGHNVKIMFYGEVIESSRQRLVIRITDSDRGPARGRAEVQLNDDRNEVAYLKIEGNNFSGEFNRKY